MNAHKTAREAAWLIQAHVGINALDALVRSGLGTASDLVKAMVGDVCRLAGPGRVFRFYEPPDSDLGTVVARTAPNGRPGVIVRISRGPKDLLCMDCMFDVLIAKDASD